MQGPLVRTKRAANPFDETIDRRLLTPKPVNKGEMKLSRDLQSSRCGKHLVAALEPVEALVESSSDPIGVTSLDEGTVHSFVGL